MKRDAQIQQLSLAMEAMEQCLEHLHAAHKGGEEWGRATVALIAAQAKVHTVLAAMVSEEVAAA